MLAAYLSISQAAADGPAVQVMTGPGGRPHAAAALKLRFIPVFVIRWALGRPMPDAK